MTSSSDADRRVLFVGDSIVAGVGDPQGRGWVGRIGEAAWASGLPPTAYALVAAAGRLDWLRSAAGG